MKGIRQAARNHGHHMTFIFSLLSLAALVAWWGIFLHNSIQEDLSHRYRNLRLKLDLLSLELGMDKAAPPGVGVCRRDPRFEIVSCGDTGRFSKPLFPHWKSYCLRIRGAVLNGIEETFRRKRVMLIGESGFLVLLILLASILLYKFTQLEKRSTREITEFWGRITHEIKTPVTGIKLLLQSLKNKTLDPGDLQPYVEMALKQVERQEQLAENLLAGLRLEGERTPLSIFDLDLPAYVKNYFHSALHLSRARVRLRGVDRDDGELTVRADRFALKVILDNLTENAVKYGPPELELDVAVHPAGNRTAVDIGDNGPGLPPKIRENVFRAYKVLKEEIPIANRGTGLGLYLSRELAQKMGGDLLLLDSDGKNPGARFRLLLTPAR